jgi:hypothetical protein
LQASGSAPPRELEDSSRRAIAELFPLATSAMNWSSVRNRMYADFGMPSRLGEYRALLETALEHGYEVCSLRRICKQLEEGLRPDKRYLVLRHDVDTGVRTAREMWRIEQQLGISGSYYFRLRTLSVPLMHAIEEHGGEASYHFEELSTVAKRRRVRRRDQVGAILPAARELFAENLTRLRRQTGLRMEIVAGHGDWINKQLGVTNSQLLTSESFRREVGIEAEAYDPALMNAVLKHSDGPYPRTWLWDGRDPCGSIRSSCLAIQVLVHPRHWQVEPVVNVLDNASRFAEELWFRVAQ